MAERVQYKWSVSDPNCPWTHGRVHVLGWRMTEAGAAEWHASRPGSTIEKVHGSDYVIGNSYGDGSFSSKLQAAGGAYSKKVTGGK